MFACPTCATPVAGSEPACPACGSGLDIAESPTGTAPHPAWPRTPSSATRRAPPETAAARPVNASFRERCSPAATASSACSAAAGWARSTAPTTSSSGKPVALKFLPRASTATTTRLARFRNEVRVARQVAHPNVCRVYDIGETDGRPLPVDGVRRRRGPRLAAAAASGVCRGDKARRDRAPALRGPGRRSRAGRAPPRPEAGERDDRRPGQGAHHRLRPGAARRELRRRRRRSGTPAYMAPEQLAGREVTARSDIYALGLVLYEIFTGKRAFRDETWRSSRQQQERARSRRPTWWRDLDPAVERVVLRCLETEPGRGPPRPTRWRRRCPAATRSPRRSPPARRRRPRWWPRPASDALCIRRWRGA